MVPLPTVFVVDDDRAFCQSLRMLLHSAGLRVEDYSSAESFLEAGCAQRPGCLVLDVRMPGWSGLELQAHLRAKRLRMPIIFITGHGDIPMAVRALKAGAVDFLEKPFDDEALLQCVYHALERDTQRRQGEFSRAQADARLARLTPREKEVMQLVAAGRSNKQIAAELNISHRTVEIYRARVMEKLGAKSICDLIRIAMTCEEELCTDPLAEAADH
ncbi:MAG: response regulator transcription factor [Gammaproteobacteria bacterium]|jgi:two-component system, LuxR family, response regulator FixJ